MRGGLLQEAFFLDRWFQRSFYALYLSRRKLNKNFKKNLWDQGIALVTYLKNQENNLERKRRHKV